MFSFRGRERNLEREDQTLDSTSHGHIRCFLWEDQGIYMQSFDLGCWQHVYSSKLA